MLNPHVETLTQWIREQVLEARCHGVVFGLSGGLDSAVVGALCQRAFPDDEVLGIIMPCHSHPDSTKDALIVANHFSIPNTIVQLDMTFDTLIDHLPHEGHGYNPVRLVMAAANIKPRLRMTTLYWFSNLLGSLVVGTGNRSEAAMGYCTKYGDAGVDIQPLGNLVKSQVRDLARELGVPEHIIDKPPSADLWEGQTDEAEMGITYEELDSYLLTGKATKGTSLKVGHQIRLSAHKFKPPPTAELN